MTESLLSTFFEKVFERVADPLISGLFQNKGFDQTLLDKLKTVLVKVDVVLSDAEEKQLTNLKVRKWVNELKDTIYHADDLLDEIITIRKLEAEVKVNQVLELLLCFLDLSSMPKLDKDIEPKLKDIVEKLESLANLGHLNLIESVRGKPPALLPSTSVVDISEMFGRENDKAVLKKILLNDNSQEKGIPVIAIVGIGGIGKTTLAQLVYNDPDVTKHFKARAWVHVTEECDVFKLTQIIFESVTSKSCIFTDLNILQVKLKKTLMKKRFLLVLDDIWKKFDIWDLLSGPLKDEGQSRSRVIVTTRNEHVASLMRPVFIHRLLHLSDGDCGRLFAKHAFNTSNSDDPILTEIGQKIVTKCAGLPLAAKTLGCLLHSKVEAEEWDRILNSTIWDLPDNDEGGCSGILPALYLSYYHLPSHLKQCFVYCSIFPKGYKFEKEKLVLLWMAEGFLEHPNIKNSMEEVGYEYFCELLSRSFFQPSSSDESCFVMHDLVNDLAQFASGEFSCKFENGKHHGISKKARYFAYLMDQFDDSEKFVFLSETEFLRTFLSLRISDTIECSSVCRMVADVWLPGLKHLRVLSFSYPTLTGLQDKSFDKLIHLRYLDLSHTLINKLPSSTCFLYNLQTLLLSSCTNLTELPEKIVILTKLRHLNVSETKLEEMPPKFGNLTSLQLLTDFVVCKNSNSGSDIGELGKFSYLRSTLSILKLENVVKADDASKAELKSKKYLKELVFKWTPATTTHHVNEVLNELQPHENLKKLTIENYGGTAFPNWLGNAIFSNMVVLRLNNCKYCTSFPPLGQLSSLQELLITKMEGLERLEDNQFYGTGQTGFQPFRSLKTLKFTELRHWRHWIHSAHGGEDFPSLQELQIQQCPKFIGSLPRHPSSTNREISGCPRFEEEEELTRRVQPQASTDQEEELARRVRPRRC
ncbi:putative disease resistance RPP13-like protein 1 [Quercus lobata]|nr:putative disease resistance RPP13-like protein 1 [Quercus lobata]